MTAGLVALCALLGTPACREATPESKVQRWAVHVLDTRDEGVDEKEGEPASVPHPYPPTRPQDPRGSQTMAPCKLLVDRACEGLGPYSDECAEARAAVPTSPSATWTDACSALVDKYVSLVRPGGHGKKVNACRELMILTCEFHGQRSWQCKQVREQVNHLGRVGNREACVGDLMAWTLKQVALQFPPGSTETLPSP